ncbi:MAG: acyltransferase [Planctomycetota bacterium]
MTQTQRPRHLPALDGVRGLAILAVMWFHLPGGSMPAISNRLIQITQPGYFGVDVFFALSGFLITRILLVEPPRLDSAKRFLIKRALRIFPIYYLFLLGYWIFDGGGTDLAGAALYAGNYTIYALGCRQDFHHLWSLAIEEHFYLLWPWIVLFLPQRWGRLACQFLIPAFALLAASLHAVWLDPKDSSFLTFLSTQTRIFTLSLGSALAYLERDGFFASKRQRSATIIVLLASLFLLLVIRKIGVGPAWPVVRLGISGLVSTSFLAFCVFDNDRSFGKLLGHTWLRKIGGISYGLYLYHQAVYCWFGLMRKSDVHPTQTMVAAILVSFCLAAFSFWWIEKPLLGFRKRLLPDPSVAPVQAAAHGVPSGGSSGHG